MHTNVMLREAHKYERTPPSLMGLTCDRPDLLNLFLDRIAEPVADCPAEGSYSLDGCIIHNGQQAFRGGEWIGDTILDFKAAAAMLPVMREICDGSHAGLRSLDDGIHTAAIFKSGSANYGHVLTDMAPKIANIGRAGHHKVRYLLPREGQWSWPVIEAVSLAFGIEPIPEPCPDGVQQIDGVHFYTPVSRHNDGPRKSHALLEMRAKLLGVHGCGGHGWRKLFVARSPKHHRGIANAAEVKALFLSFGFEIVHPERLSFPEQIRLFSEASHIAGPLGAAMANMIFAPSGCKILMLDPGIGDRYFWDLACLTQQKFHWLLTAPLEHYTLERATAPFAVDTKAVLTAFEAMGLSRGSFVRRRVSALAKLWRGRSSVSVQLSDD